MTFQWDGFLDLADTLLKQASALATQASETASSQGPSEALLRTTVSRSYYAAYHLTRAYVEAAGRGAPPSENSHTWVWSQLWRQEEKTIRENGFGLRNLRNAADYELGCPNPTEGGKPATWLRSAEYSILTARRIQSLLQRRSPTSLKR